MRVEVTNSNPGVMFEALPDRSLFVHDGAAYIKTKVMAVTSVIYDAIQFDSQDAYTFKGNTMVHPVKSIKVDY